jgi:cytochrome c-type biogenesis protein CcmH
MIFALVLAVLLQSDFAGATAPGAKVPDASQFVGAPQAKPLTGTELDHRTVEVAGLLRCPVCQGLSIADSPSEMAINMKGQVHELLSRGYTQDQILSYFEQSYGQFVLLRPKFRGVNALVWLLPIAALAFGALAVFAKTRNLAAPLPGAAADDDEYVAKVRALVDRE